MKRKAIIVSIKGKKLSKREKILLSKEKPWGIILFKRNLNTPKQIKKLTSNIRSLTKNKKFPIIIDEEGQRVSRLENLINHNISANFFGNLFRNDKNACFQIFKEYIRSLSKILKDLGININTIPVLDILRKDTNKIIGNRSFSYDKKIVRKLGELTVRNLHSNNIASIINIYLDMGQQNLTVIKKCQKSH